MGQRLLVGLQRAGAHIRTQFYQRPIKDMFLFLFLFLGRSRCRIPWWLGEKRIEERQVDGIQANGGEAPWPKFWHVLGTTWGTTLGGHQ